MLKPGTRVEVHHQLTGTVAGTVDRMGLIGIVVLDKPLTGGDYALVCPFGEMKNIDHLDEDWAPGLAPPVYPDKFEDGLRCAKCGLSTSDMNGYWCFDKDCPTFFKASWGPNGR